MNGRTAELIAALQRQRLDLAAVHARIQGAQQLLAQASVPQWRGPARSSFDASVWFIESLLKATAWNVSEAHVHTERALRDALRHG